MIFPVLLIVLFTWVRYESIKDEINKRSYIGSNEQDFTGSCGSMYGENVTNIYFSPNSEWLESFVQNTLNIDSNIEINSFASSEELDEFLNRNRTNRYSLFGLEFDDSLRVTNLKLFPSHILKL